MKRFLKWITIIFVVLIALIFTIGFILNEPKPDGEPSPAAELMAQKMAKAVNIQAWDTINCVEWDFMDMHHYLWDKQRNFVRILWGNYMVLLHTKSLQGIAEKSGEKLSGNAREKVIQKAWKFFCNDSFWLNAPVKVFDPGTVRSVVQLKDGRKGLMVNYTSGGVTPGDSYVWLLDKNGLPASWKMWVKILPIGGIEVSWENWRTINGGAEIATSHKAGFFNLKITHLKAAQDWRDFDYVKDPFEALVSIHPGS